jgi:alginate O-acetyltransferase complex protein AlgI
MNYLSIPFLILLASTLLLFYIWPKKLLKYRYFLFLVASYVFICFYDWRCGLVVLGNTLVSYLCGLLTYTQKQPVQEPAKPQDSNPYEMIEIEGYGTPVISTPKQEETKKHTSPMVLSILLNVGLLAAVKYFNWAGGMVASLINKPFSTFNFIVPLGVSFYVFTLVAYNVDVWRKKFPAEKNFFKFATFVSFFPKLAEGPIVNYDEVTNGNDSLFNEKRFGNIDQLKHFQRIVLGLCKKVLIADILGVYVSYIWTNWAEMPGWYFILAAFLYAIQLYCDFSGFMDMSIGIAGLLGVVLPENFNVPYLSKTVQEFWRRWHITLGRWFKNYIYIPCGGNRVNKFRWVLNVLLVWLITGLWHGASWTFVLWGLYFGVILVIGGLLKLLLQKHSDAHQGKIANGLRVVRTFILVTIGWFLFSAPSLSSALLLLSFASLYANGDIPY